MISEKTNTPIIAALGFFDSVHYGHRIILQTAKKIAVGAGCETAVFTFINNMLSPFNPDAKLIYTYCERTDIFDEMNLDFVLPVFFDDKFRHTDRQEFLSRLITDYNIRGFVCGYDYRFGQGGEGDVSFLQNFCQDHKLLCEIVPEITLDGVRVSSTEIRSLIKNRDIIQANRYLCAPYFIKGTVMHGRGVGKLFDFPTANLSVSIDKLLPGEGVYATKTFFDGVLYKSVTNIGAKPTFNETSISIETLLSDFNGDLYGKEIKVYFHKFLRSIEKFDSPLELKNRIYKDLLW